MSASTLRKLQQAREKLQNGETIAAAALCEDALARAPRNPEALWLLGTIRLMTGAPDAAAALLERAVDLLPGHGASLENLGVAYLMLGRYPAAESVLREALALAGAPPSVRMRLGIALLRQGRHGAAMTELERVVAIEGTNADARLNLGQAYAGTGDLVAAARQFEQALSCDPHNPDALYNLGLVLLESEPDRARSCFERILVRIPSYVDAHERLATMHLAVGRYGEAVKHLREITRAQPANAAALSALANALFQLGTLDEAQAIAEKACALDATQPAPYSVLAQIHQVRNDFEHAVAVLEQGYEHTRSNGLAGPLVYLLHRMCDWPKWQDAWARMAVEIDQSANFGSPFGLLNEVTSPEQQLSYTRRWAAARFGTPAAERPAPPRKLSTPRRLRVGYFSADFKEHAAAYLIAEVLELHDRERFEIYAYSYGPDDASPMRARLHAAVEHFIDIAWDPDDVIANRMREDDLDVLVELKGYTVGHRLSVLAQRPCPVQVTWLGYPGTTGADFIDYLIADDYIVPAGAEKFYSERVLRLPHCYQPNDRKRPLAEPRSREEYGLPQEAFVFSCFNQAVKIIPEVFGRWMNLLRRVPGSVLWLAEDNRWATANLKQAAHNQGIAPERLIYTPRMPFAQHLARYRVADLSLDTFPYTSHTMASDSLWMGCPLVGLCGESFTSRVSGSILSSCDLPDLITHGLDEYEELAHRLATNASYFRDVRARLALSRDTVPLFDSVAFARNLEHLYVQIAPV